MKKLLITGLLLTLGLSASCSPDDARKTPPTDVDDASTDGRDGSVPSDAVDASADSAVADAAVGDSAVADAAVGDSAVADAAVGDSAVPATPPKEGCAYETIHLDSFPSEPLKAVSEVESVDGDLDLTLKVNYADQTLAGCGIRVRNYNGGLVGPTLRFSPGDTLKIQLVNDLPENTDGHPENINLPHHPNTTNLHVHGLHVDPGGTNPASDNVLITVAPGATQSYEINIPADHPPGTFWYHPHVHGSTALQVGSGMSGALIIKGGLDDVPEIAAAADKIMLIQHIPYDEQGVVERYSTFSGQPGLWQASKRRATLNGQILPIIEMRPGEVQRWRFIHAGIGESVFASLQDHKLHEIALDGLALGTMHQWDEVELESGYRVDVLVKAKPLEAGETEHEYFLYDESSDAEESLRNLEEPRSVLARVIVRGELMDMPLPDVSSLVPLRPHPEITEEELIGEDQRVQFNLGFSTCEPYMTDGNGNAILPFPLCEECDPAAGIEGCEFRFTINDVPFHPENVRQMKLNQASEWTLSSKFANHPFHIHVNPFEVERKDPDGNTEKIWKDTLLVKAADGEIKVRSRYEVYKGKFVIHCHILDHEDQGMMQVVEVVD